MKKLKMTATTLTFEEGYNKYLEYCRQRNLRQGTMGHYRQSYYDENTYFISPTLTKKQKYGMLSNVQGYI